ncbi:enoyl-CoA hydratase/isomerase family protein [Mycobacterium florentinum]|uniref:enoyl-CoA hydratase/isomerase family protein n=1 Tax=Mycobacterium florentinum TaxID=292462 RepID=UPI000A155CAD|nr:enoyl-CoA hydratase-related protein [Mycobacterium florentinum]MCV7412458.1 enoyl-CoA hydratase/isomerase family protein [Mycobacterium florentinum]BBX81841.1 2-(1,2-epoxy-1,2-dihydrophenyl)acetyl-CoA isomerase [Mycobacterium florentinum]
MTSSTSSPDRTPPTADVLVERDETVGIITINRPARLNAVTPEAGDTLRSAFLELEADSRIRAVVLTGAGRGFCAGADISGDVGNAREVLLDSWNPLVLTMRSLQIPIIAAVNGVAAGAGVSLALACDLRVAATSARFELSFAKIGLMPDAGLTWLLPRVVGLGRANEMALLAERLSAPEAHTWGLVNQLAADGQALGDAVAMARRFAELSVSVATIKQAHQRALGTDFADQLKHEAHTQGWLQEQPDFAEATRAFAEKRPAQLTERKPPDQAR